MEGCQLLPQREVFQDQFPVTAERQGECADDHDQQFQHVRIVAVSGSKFNSYAFWRWTPGSRVPPGIIADVTKTGPPRHLFFTF